MRLKECTQSSQGKRAGRKSERSAVGEQQKTEGERVYEESTREESRWKAERSDKAKMSNRRG
jgi:hypothetical protein